MVRELDQSQSALALESSLKWLNVEKKWEDRGEKVEGLRFRALLQLNFKCTERFGFHTVVFSVVEISKVSSPLQLFHPTLLLTKSQSCS